VFWGDYLLGIGLIICLLWGKWCDYLSRPKEWCDNVIKMKSMHHWVRCMAHRCNLIMETFENLSLVGKIKTLLEPRFAPILPILQTTTWNMGS